MRPPSIVRFEQFYLGAFALGLLNAVFSWKDRTQMMADNPQTAAMAGWLMPTTIALSIAVTALLWYFTARRPSVVAKWIVVVFAGIAGLSAIPVLLALVGGRAGSTASSLLSLVQVALSISAAVMLFKPDAKEWFGEGFDDDAEDEII